VRPNKRLLRDSHRGAGFYRFAETFETSAIFCPLLATARRDKSASKTVIVALHQRCVPVCRA
jgi:hypothetical protein